MIRHCRSLRHGEGLTALNLEQRPPSEQNFGSSSCQHPAWALTVPVLAKIENLSICFVGPETFSCSSRSTIYQQMVNKSVSQNADGGECNVVLTSLNLELKRRDPHGDFASGRVRVEDCAELKRRGFLTSEPQCGRDSSVTRDKGDPALNRVSSTCDELSLQIACQQRGDYDPWLIAVCRIECLRLGFQHNFETGRQVKKQVKAMPSPSR